MSDPKIEIRRGRTKLFRFVVIAANGETLATSEHYKQRRTAYEGARALVDAAKFIYENADRSLIIDKTIPKRYR
jgi:uncharacterized protein YegP (UPF0339 family)